MENSVEMNMPEVSLDDAALNPVQEQEEVYSDISEVVAEPETTVEETAQQSNPPAKEPGWIKQRVDKAVIKAVRETEERMRAEFEKTLAPIRESVLERQADELVSSGEFKSKERALEYLQLKSGMPVTASTAQEQQSAQRDAQGRFTPKQPQQETMTAENRVRAGMLAKQAEKIQASRGLDVATVFKNSPEIQQKVLSGEWDFYDVADAMSKKRIPSPVRSSNGATIGAVSIADMTDEQFARLNENLAKGKIYDAR